ncbi:MAG TPA: hypothetical protein DCZ95_08035 [Verrucomicrobia bacterium]|nr:MAG: hypothetical protein A2X46_12700 [Lentisphaerae bacterium GWF2_57_35]HBA84026.1 hypothetical protein [Verrucomicrobiota bacterium]
MKLFVRKLTVFGIVMAAAVGSAMSAQAQMTDDSEGWPGIALGVDVGTTGLGGKGTVCIVPEYLNIRGGYSWASFTFNTKIEDIDYDLEANLSVFPAMLDLHPFANHFRISGGVFFNGSDGTLTAKSDKSFRIGDANFTPEQYGTLKGTLKLENSTCPYIGIGYGNAVYPDQAFSFVFDLGVMFTAYDVSMTSEGGTMSNNPILLANLAKEEEKVQKDADDFKFYPVLSFGVAYHF